MELKNLWAINGQLALIGSIQAFNFKQKLFRNKKSNSKLIYLDDKL